MKRSLTILACLTALAAPAFAQTATPAASTPVHEHKGHGSQEHRAAMREKWQNATPAEKEKMRAEHQARFEERYKNATPEERKRMDERKARHDARKAKWDAMTPAEREAAKAKMQERHAKWEAMSPEERAKAKAEWRAKKAERQTAH